MHQDCIRYLLKFWLSIIKQYYCSYKHTHIFFFILFIYSVISNIFPWAIVLSVPVICRYHVCPLMVNRYTVTFHWNIQSVTLVTSNSFQWKIKEIWTKNIQEKVFMIYIKRKEVNCVIAYIYYRKVIVYI